jgi:protease-4
MKKYICFMMIILPFFLSGCMKIALFSGAEEPLKEITLEGKGKQKILVIPVRGFISDAPKRGLLRTRQSLVERVAAQLKKAEKDPDIRAVLLKIDSPGGTVTASDLLYHEFSEYKKRTGVKLVAAMMDVAASGGYYIAAAADWIMAHPTTLTGSIGVIFVQPTAKKLMDKIGVGVNVYKTGLNKDMGAFFRQSTAEEKTLFQRFIDQFGQQFYDRVLQHRTITDDAMKEVRTARIFSSKDAKALGLIDDIGYLDDAVEKAKSISGLSDDASVVVYRRTRPAEDTIYNTASSVYEAPDALLRIDVPGISHLKTGFYYLWHPAAGVY